MLFKRRKSRTRSEILETAGKAQAKGKRKKAIVEYRKLLKTDPQDYVVHGKIAPLLAEAQKFSESWSSFKAAGEGYLHKGFDDKARSVYIQATRYLPNEIEAWEAVVGLQLDKGQRADALKTLFDGRRHFRRSSHRQEAIHLLRMAWDISPWHFEVTFDLAQLLAKTGEKEEALKLLNGLAERERGRNLRHIRGAILRTSPAIGSLWRWLRTALSNT
jgi:tetratricopeptide (TPR) repeat protein